RRGRRRRATSDRWRCAVAAAAMRSRLSGGSDVTGDRPCIAVVAASSVVPRLELEVGVERLRGEGLEVSVDPRCLEQHFTYAGGDAARARSFWEAAVDPEIDALWMARGGYGATRLLPELERLTVEHVESIPRKLLVGYS